MRSPNLILTTTVTIVLAVLVFLGLMTAPRLAAQAPAAQSLTIPQWQIDAGGKMAFDVASVKQNKSGDPPSGDQMYSNVALGPGDVYAPNGGLFIGKNMPLFRYIKFAYKATANQNQILRAEVPKWVLSDRFDIEARAGSKHTKDQMRLMMKSLLADRFKLEVHYETRQLPVFILVQLKHGQTGPHLQEHPGDSPCTTDPLPPSGPARPATVSGGFPALCGGIFTMRPSAPGLTRMGAQNVTMQLIAGTLAETPGTVDRPVLDRTGLRGTFDFTLERTPEVTGPHQSDSTFQPDSTGPTFLEALTEQLGLKLESQKGPVDVIVVDHVEEPSPN